MFYDCAIFSHNSKFIFHNFISYNCDFISYVGIVLALFVIITTFSHNGFIIMNCTAFVVFAPLLLIIVTVYNDCDFISHNCNFIFHNCDFISSSCNFISYYCDSSSYKCDSVSLFQDIFHNCNFISSNWTLYVAT